MRYNLYPHAGEVPYSDWAALGIKVPVFDKDGTLGPLDSLILDPTVIDGMKKQEMPDIFPQIAIVSNNSDPWHVDEFAGALRRRLGVGVYAVAKGHGYKGKPHPEMGHVVARGFGVQPDQLGVIGDRLWTDAVFGHRVGVGAVALTTKVGEGDAPLVSTLRRLENLVIRLDTMRGHATPHVPSEIEE